MSGLRVRRRLRLISPVSHGACCSPAETGAQFIPSELPCAHRKAPRRSPRA